MIIPITLLNDPHYRLEGKDKFILLISLLHYHKKINEASLNAHFKAIRNNTFERFIKTFYCKINKTWYNNQNIFDVYFDVFNKTCPKTNITLDTFLKYLNRYYNANKNYCLNVVYFNYLKPIIDSYDSVGNIIILRETGLPTNNDIITYAQADSIGNLSDGYCCEDCDGDYQQYKQSRYTYDVFNPTRDKLNSKFKDYLLSLKTHRKNFIDPMEEI